LSRIPSADRLPRSFYERPVLAVARAVLGRVLVHDEPNGGRVAGRIVEVEAYRGADDPASHAYRGPTARNRVMFGAAGHAYVYFTYGMHFCLNLVTGPAGRASAVLIRALEPVEGEEGMRRRRGAAVPWERLMRGPGCVARALGLDRRHNGLDLTSGPLWVAAAPARRGGKRIVVTPRIGIRVAQERLWRFHLEGHPCVSGPRATARPSRRAAARPRRAETVDTVLSPS
jgi:DNA-3-methyladenine glycosylase